MAFDVDDGYDVFDLFAEGICDYFLNTFLLKISFYVITVKFHDEQTLTFEQINTAKIFILKTFDIDKFFLNLLVGISHLI